MRANRPFSSCILKGSYHGCAVQLDAQHHGRGDEQGQQHGHRVGNAQVVNERVGQETHQDVYGIVREVRHPGHAVDQGEPHSYECERDAVDRTVDENVH